jgi:large subunit ribosomal protein L6
MSTDDAPPRDRVSVPVPKGVTVSLHGPTLTVKGPLGSASRRFPHEALGVAVAADHVELTLLIPPNRKKAKALLHTWESHAKNLVAGVTIGFEAKMKAVAAHFPMKVVVKDSTLVIENFLGEKHPRTAPLIPGVAAQVDGDFVLLSGVDIEQVGQSAANIERATHIRDYDPRVFQDGIYIVERAHVKGTG